MNISHPMSNLIQHLKPAAIASVIFIMAGCTTLKPLPQVSSPPLPPSAVKGPTSAVEPGKARPAGYGERIRSRIRSNITYSGEPSANTIVLVEIQAAPNGRILKSTLKRSSGNAEWDAAVMQALKKTASLPLDDNGAAPSKIELSFRPH